ncbi:MAG: LysM peptidoglycan-binding domain-containing protein [Deltaproteobacteria bacterium]|nr:LysM peptidoglycan-binding domain-containing protein [Deltaproteobacteria bacterium]
MKGSSKVSGARGGPPVEPPAGAADGDWYRIESGDTLWRLSRRFQVPFSSLLGANPQIVNPDRIYAGRYLWIPAPHVAAELEAGISTASAGAAADRAERADLRPAKTTGTRPSDQGTQTPLAKGLSSPGATAGSATPKTQAVKAATETAAGKTAPAAGDAAATTSAAAADVEAESEVDGEAETEEVADDDGDEEASDDQTIVTNGAGTTARFFSSGWQVLRYIFGGAGAFELIHRPFTLLPGQAADGAGKPPLAVGGDARLTAMIHLPEDDLVRLDEHRRQTTAKLQKDKSLVFWAETTGGIGIKSTLGGVWSSMTGGTEMALPGHFDLQYSLLVPYKASGSEAGLFAPQVIARHTLDLPVTAEKAKRLLPGARFVISRDLGLGGTAKQKLGTLGAELKSEGSVIVDRLGKERVRVAFTSEVEDLVEADASGGAAATSTDPDGSAPAVASGSKGGLRFRPTLKKSGTRSRTESYVLDLSKPGARAAYDQIIGGNADKARDLADAAGSGVKRDADETAARGNESSLGLDFDTGNVTAGLSFDRGRNFETTIRSLDDDRVEVRVSRGATLAAGPHYADTPEPGSTRKALMADLGVTRDDSVVEVYVLDLSKPGTREALRAVRNGDLAALRALVLQDADGVEFTPESRHKARELAAGAALGGSAVSLKITNRDDETASFSREAEDQVAITLGAIAERGLAPEAALELNSEQSVSAGGTRQETHGREELYKLDLKEPAAAEAYRAARRGDFSRLRRAKDAEVKGIVYAWQRLQSRRQDNLNAGVAQKTSKRGESVKTSTQSGYDIEAVPLIDGKYQVTVRKNRATELGVAADKYVKGERPDPNAAVVPGTVTPPKSTAVSVGLGDVVKRGQDRSLVYVFDPNDKAARRAFDALLAGDATKAEALAKRAGSGVTLRESTVEDWWGNRLTGNLGIAMTNGVTAGLEMYTERLADNDARLTGSDVRQEVTKQAADAGRPVAWFGTGGVLKAGFDTPVKVGPASPGFGADAELEYHCLVPSTAVEAPVASPRLLPSNWQKALAYPPGSEVTIRGKGTLRTSLSHTKGAEAKVGSVELAASAGVVSTASTAKDLALVFHRLGGSTVRLIVADGAELTGKVSLEAQVKATLAADAGDSDRELAGGIVGKQYRRLQRNFLEKLTALLQARAAASESVSDATQKAIAFDFDLSTASGRAAYERLVGLDVAAVEAAVAKNEPGIAAVGKYRDFDAVTQQNLTVNLFGLDLVNDNRERRDRVASLLNSEGRKDFVVQDFTATKSGILKTGSVRFATVAVRDRSENRDERFLHLKLDNLRDKWTSRGEVDRFRRFISMLGAKERTSIVAKTDFDFWDKLNPAVHGDTTARADVYFTEGAIGQIGHAEREAAITAYAKALAALDGEDQLPAWASDDPEKRRGARALLEEYDRSVQGLGGEGNDDYWRFSANQIGWDAMEYRMAKEFAEFVLALGSGGARDVVFTDALDAKTEGAREQVESARRFLRAFAELGRQHGFDFYAAIAAMNGLATKDVVLLQQLEIRGDQKQVVIDIEPAKGLAEPYVYVRQTFTPTAISSTGPVTTAKPVFSLGPSRWQIPGSLSAVGSVPPSVVSSTNESPLESASRLFDVSRYGQALEVLRRPGIDSSDVRVIKLTAKCNHMKGNYNETVRALERLVRSGKADTEAMLWLADGYARLAERAGAGPTDGAAAALTRKAIEYAQRARQAEPGALEPAALLFELYLATPLAVGGGIDKARELVSAIRSRFPVDSHLMLARYYEKRAEAATDAEQRRSHLSAAEAEIKQVVVPDAADIGPELELARFFARRGRTAEAGELLSRLRARTQNVTRLLFESAVVLEAGDQNLDQVEALLVEYLRHELSPADPPATVAKEILARVRDKLGKTPPPPPT